MKEYKKNIFLDDPSAYYYKDFRSITGTVTSAILWQHIERLFSLVEGEKFSRFIKPVNSQEIPEYEEGKSWCEEINFSYEEFKNAFKKIGISYKSKSDWEKEKDPFKGMMYCSYYDRIKHKNWYMRDHKRVKENYINMENLKKQNIENLKKRRNYFINKKKYE